MCVLCTVELVLHFRLMSVSQQQQGSKLAFPVDLANVRKVAKARILC